MPILHPFLSSNGYKRLAFIPLFFPFLPEVIPPSRGSYVLFFFLNQLTLVIRNTQRIVPRGYYCYCGSALGKGGLRSRLLRHLIPMKKIFWHIDHLTPNALFLALFLYEDSLGSWECLFAQALCQLPNVSIPLPGFGSTDCKEKCISHLLYSPRRWDGKEITKMLLGVIDKYEKQI
ncbi:GIY-YIG nuclease family protein [Candidatus Methylacidiphilum infernorum]|uniref:GIY-YIG nuclease family protein n=1 Tax=Candidatus Methylacidiphilum infernorum TaxID=511746 RepID=UPI00068B4B5E|nr:GIY-YIG nuclease family protein [Candidatus Methylacidiphilum infernorum]